MATLQELAASELGYVVLLFALFIVPRYLQRWRLPSAVTSFGLGVVAGLGFGLYQNDATIHLLATFGIVAIFLFAGLEVDLLDLKAGAGHLVRHLAIRMVLLLLMLVALDRLFGLGLRPATLVALALLTPSTGFILDTLTRFGLTSEEQFWIKTKAIGTELLALAILFVVLQSASLERLGLASAALFLIVALLPPIFRLFATRIAPHAPKAEFAFLVMIALVTAYATRTLGVYYLVGAFLVGVAARRFRESLPAMASERMLHAVEVFASFFAPFYFFGAGVELRREALSLTSLALGTAFFVVAVPLRLGSVALLRRWMLGEGFRASARIAIPMLPTLVFTLVLAGILRDSFGVSGPLIGGLIVYAMLTTLIPGFFFGAPTPTFDEPELPDLPPSATQHLERRSAAAANPAAPFGIPGQG
jgi:Kef-type K+ transport system membrane component KefB